MIRGPFCDHLKRLIAENPQIASRRQVVRGESVYTCGDSDDRIYVLERGQLKTTIYSAEGKQCLLAIYGEGDTFGELGVLGGIRHETVIAMRDSVVWHINAARFFNLLGRDHNLVRCYLRIITERVSDQQQTITQLVTLDGEHRLAATLLRIGRKLGQRIEDQIWIEGRITQEELASMVGTTRSRIGLFLKNFRERGLVHQLQDGRLCLDETRLLDYVEDGADPRPPAPIPAPVTTAPPAAAPVTAGRRELAAVAAGYGTRV
ncbi:MAG TPA: Crp/Fnr family transcriptional regulator [Kineosporiaceae bacterium]